MRMSHLNLMHLEESRRPAFGNDDVEGPVAVDVASAGSLPRPRGARGDRIKLMVLIVGLFALAWMHLMQNVRVGLPGLVTAAPVGAKAGSPDGGSTPTGTPAPSRPTSPESP